jgi:hypothetical protein
LGEDDENVSVYGPEAAHFAIKESWHSKTLEPLSKTRTAIIIRIKGRKNASLLEREALNF